MLSHLNLKTSMMLKKQSEPNKNITTRRKNKDSNTTITMSPQAVAIVMSPLFWDQTNKLSLSKNNAGI